MQVLENSCEVFPLERIMADQDLDLEKMIRRREPIVLLSQINRLEREWVEQLEQSGIYDTDDLFSCTDHLPSILGRDEDVVGDFVIKVRQELENYSTHPRMKQNFPENYALMVVDEKPRRTAILWKGLLIEIQNEEDNYWFGIKMQLENLLTKMHQPKLVGRIGLDDPPQWLKRVEPLKNYVENLSETKEPIELATSWGLQLEGIGNSLEKELIALAYLIEIAMVKKGKT